MESLTDRSEFRSSRISTSSASNRCSLVAKPEGRVKSESGNCVLDQDSSGKLVWLKNLFEPVMTAEFRSCLQKIN